MRRLDRLWRALECIPRQTELLVVWRQILGEDFEVSQRFLRPTAERARCYPCPSPGGEGCPRKVVVHGPGDIVAVCQDPPPSCDRLVLTEEDIVLYEVDLSGLGTELASALGIARRWEEIAFGSWSLGVYFDPRGRAVPVHLLVQLTPEDFERRLGALLLGAGSFLLLAPTSGHCSSRMQEALRRRQCPFLPLDEVIRADQSGRLRCEVELSALVGAPDQTGGLSGPSSFRPSGDHWTVHFLGKTLHPRNQKGMEYLRLLLSSPGQEHHSAQLVSMASGKGSAISRDRGESQLDEKAIETLHKEYESLQDQLDEAL